MLAGNVAGILLSYFLDYEGVAKGRITLLAVILAKVRIHVSAHIPDFNCVEKGLNP